MLSIIIVNYKQPELLINCIDSIVANTHTILYEILVVDNDNNEYCKKVVQERFSFIKVYKTGYNAGFARANNLGMRNAVGDIFLLLNSDTLITPSALDICETQFRQSSYVACGLQLLNQDLSYQMSGYHFTRGNFGILLKLPYVKLLYTIVNGTPNLQISINKKHAKEVDWINGAFLMVKKEAVDKAGLMDEDFFLYSEEVEWCARLGKYGLLGIFSNANVIHLQGGSFEAKEGKGYYGVFDKRGLQLLVSEFLRTKKQFGSGLMLIQYAIFVCYTPVFLLILTINYAVSFRHPKYSFSNWWGYTINVYKCMPYIWRALRGKPFFYKVL